MLPPTTGSSSSKTDCSIAPIIDAVLLLTRVLLRIFDLLWTPNVHAFL
jgi:hypothetical protein